MSASYALAIISLLGACWSVRYNNMEDDAAYENHMIGDWDDHPWFGDKTCRDFHQNSIVHELHGEKPRAVAKPKAALYAVLVQTSDHSKTENMVEDALEMFSSSRKVGMTIPMHMIAANLSLSDTERLSDAGIVVHNFTHEIENAKSWYKPVYDKKSADAQGRTWLEEIPVQSRKDGWACYFKFFAWTAPFDVVLFTDLDSRFRGLPVDNLVHAVGNSEVPFMTCPEKAFKPYLGFNSHRMILRPSKKVFDSLVRKASAGDYVPYTNTEQDVLDCYFDVKSSIASLGNFSDLC